MFPAPTTIAISTPCSWSSAISVAICSTSCRSSPYALSPIRASPDSFSRMRRKAGLPLCLPGKGVALVLENFELMLLERLVDGLARVVDPLLVGQDCLAEEPLREHPLDDLLAMLLGAGLHLGQLLQDLELGRKVLLGDLVAVGVQRRREGNVHRKQPCDLGGTLDPHEDADLVRRRMDGSGEVAFGLLERALRVHHPRAGLVAELLYECRRNLSHRSSPPSPLQPRSRRRFPLVPWARARPGSRPQRAR